MLDGQDNELQAGDIIVCRHERTYGRMTLARVANLTKKGLAYHYLQGTGKKRDHMYDPHAVALISTAHRDESLEECRVTFSKHARQNKDLLAYYDMACNLLEVDSMVAYTYRDDKDLSFGYIRSILDSSRMTAITGSHKVLVQPLGGTKLATRHMSEVARVDSPYKDLNPALIRDLFLNF